MLNNKRLRAKVVKNNQLNVVHDNDLENLLKSLNVFDSVMAGQKECLFCKKTIVMENIMSIVPHKGMIEFTCNSPKCQSRLVGLE